MAVEPADFFRVFAPPFVDERLWRYYFGAYSEEVNPDVYLRTPLRARPVLSCFFDPQYYLAINSDVAAADIDPFVHFLQYGCAEGRRPHALIDFSYMRSCDPFVLSAAPTLSQLQDALFLDLVDPSPYFSLEYYRRQLPKATPLPCGLLGHFLTDGLPAGLRPNPKLAPLWYYRQLDAAHDVWSGLRHFVTIGDREAFSPSPEFNSKAYLERYPDVTAGGSAPLAHYLCCGQKEGRGCWPVAAQPIASLPITASDPDVDAEKSLNIYQCLREKISARRQASKDSVRVKPFKIEEVSELFDAVASLEFPKFDLPRVSILIPAFNQAKYTAECLRSILTSVPKVTYEVIIADDASSEESALAFAKVRNVKYLRQPKNLGFLRNCNEGFRCCSGEYLFLLNNDAQLRPGALDALVQILDENPVAGAAGPMILYPNGRLQEAGCSINRDGVSHMIGLFSDPALPAFNFDREVTYCSGAALLVRVNELEGTLFDEGFAPAYCEDVDLCLRLQSGQRSVIYCSNAHVVHHLSVSTSRGSQERRLQLIAKNQQRLSQKWAPLLEEMNRVRTIAFYLPQYYPTRENNFHWGQGFTEWTNVTKATPAYVGHYQPHLPADLGFYDLRVKQTMQKQALLARRYGLSGFCVYYYNFGGRRALEQAFEAMVADSGVDFPYCVCWANENWTRHWDGGDRELIFEQQYDESTLLAVILDAIRYAADPRYIRVRGKPVFLVYRVLSIPDPLRFATLCRDKFRQAGFDGLYLVYVQSMEAADRPPRPSDFGFDACVEFPPQGLQLPCDPTNEGIIKDDFKGARYDYEVAALKSIDQPSVDYKRHSCVFPGWDNTPRQPLKGDSFTNATPEAFQVYVEEKLQQVTEQFVGDERLLFVNAWNEWAEGAHLEPDQRFGHRWLEAIRNALLAKSLA